MWRSKPSPLRTWLARWKIGSYLPHLFGRILKPCQWSRFETELKSSHLAIPVNLSQQRENVQEKKTPDTSGPTSLTSSEQLDLFDASLKTSKDTSALDCERSLQTWKALVIQRRGEYSQRVKLAHLTKEKESTSWPTPSARDHKGASGWGRQERKGFPKDTLPNAITNWPTPSAHEARLGYQDRSDPNKKGTQESLTTVIVNKAGGRSVCTGHLNPDWVEWLMGVPIGWTELGCWGTESCQQPQQKRGEC